MKYCAAKGVDVSDVALDSTLRAQVSHGMSVPEKECLANGLMLGSKSSSRPWFVREECVLKLAIMLSRYEQLPNEQ